MAHSSRPLALLLLLVAIGQALLWFRFAPPSEVLSEPAVDVAFVGPVGTSSRSSSVALRAEGEEAEKPKRKKVKTPFRGIDLDGDRLTNLDDWYKEGIKGDGSKPTGIIRDLILRSFYGKKFVRGFPVWEPSLKYTGKHGRPCPTDYDTAYENMKTLIKEGNTFVGKDDGKGWIWLTAGDVPGGLFLCLHKSPPFGDRPLALIRADNVDEFFDKVNWHMMFVRLHKWNLWGGPVVDFPYPTKRSVESVKTYIGELIFKKQFVLKENEKFIER